MSEHLPETPSDNETHVPGAKDAMKAYYADHFVLPLPEGHRFPMAKYAMLRAQAVEHGILRPNDLFVPAAATDTQLLHVHDADYLASVKHGTLSPKAVRKLGFPWTLQLVERSRRSVGGTIGACRSALQHGIAVNLAGGTHHAFRDHGAGFCVFNDVAVAARTMLAEQRVRRVAILDCDVHQGDGTASVLQGDDRIYTFSIHGAKNFPFHKQQSDLDIDLADGTADRGYLDALSMGLHQALDAAQPDLAIYLAGADPYSGDRLGRLDVSKEGLAERDHMVFDLCWSRGIPVATVMAGGYARDVQDIVDIHLKTVELAAYYAFCYQGNGAHRR